MRTEKEMMDLILGMAEADERIFAAYLKGSRANPNAPQDRYRDYDVMYVVSETKSFMQDTRWMEHFGKVIFSQEQDMDFGYGDRFHIRDHYDESYSWLLLFEDGNRIDLGVETIPVMKSGRNRNKLFLPLFDKIGCLPQLPPTDADFYIKRPTEKNFSGCCNEFYWSICDTAKGIARDELPFAMTTYHACTRPMLETMLDWYIGTCNGYTVSSGKFHKYFKKQLPADMYSMYQKIYCDGSYHNFWSSIEAACQLFKKAAAHVAGHCQFSYPVQEEQAARSYIQFIRSTLDQPV